MSHSWYQCCIALKVKCIDLPSMKTAVDQWSNVIAMELPYPDVKHFASMCLHGIK